MRGRARRRGRALYDMPLIPVLPGLAMAVGDAAGAMLVPVGRVT